MIRNIPINPNLSLNGCWRLANACQCADPEEQLQRIQVADAWFTANKVIDMDAYDSLMNTLAYLSREAFQRKRGY